MDSWKITLYEGVQSVSALKRDKVAQVKCLNKEIGKEVCQIISQHIRELCPDYDCIKGDRWNAKVFTVHANSEEARDAFITNMQKILKNAAAYQASVGEEVDDDPIVEDASSSDENGGGGSLIFVLLLVAALIWFLWK